MQGPEDSDLSRLTRDLARSLDCHTVVALGCARADRLAALQGDLELIGFDGRHRLEAFRRRLPEGRCEEWDPEGGRAPPLSAERLRGAIVVCDGLLESVADPNALLRSIRELLAHAVAAIVVMPDRDLVRGGDLAPRQGGDARWSAAELASRLEANGIELSWIGLAAAPSNPLERSSLLAVLGGTRADELPDLLATGARNLGFDPAARSPAAEEGRQPLPLRVCIASYEFVGPTRTGGIGTAYTSLAEALAEAGHDVTVLFTGWRDPDDDTSFSHWANTYSRRGINLVELRSNDFPAIRCGHYNAQISFLTYLWLRQRDRERPFDVIHFPETLGHGYFSLLAKRQGWAFGDTTLVTGVHSPSQWVLEANRAAFLTGQEFADDFLERGGVALSDVVISPSAYLLDWMRGRHWKLPGRIFVQQYVGSRATRAKESATVAAGAGRDADGPIEEVVFFGRLETRKGLVLFCDALDFLAEEGALPGISISFLGKQAVVQGALAEDFLEARSERWPWKWRIRDRFKQPEAIAYLRGAVGRRARGRRLAVMPSLADNTPNTVMEATALGIPFIASRAGGTAELIHPLDLARCSFDPRGRGGAVSLATAIRDAVERSELRPARPAVDPSANEAVHVRWHEAIRAAEPPGPRPRPRRVARRAQPPVSVCIVVREGRRIEEAIAAIEEQDYPDLELVVVDDSEGSRDLDSLRDRSSGPHRLLLRADEGDRMGPGNLAARNARGEYLLFLHEDAVADPRQLSALVRVAEDTGSDVVSCVSWWEDGEATGLIVPEGGPALSGLFYRSFAGGAYLIRRTVFERLGGFDPTAEAAFEDHELLCRAALEGCAMHVVPEPLLREPAPVGQRGIPIDHPEAALAVLRTYERHAPDGLRDLARVARAHWSMAHERSALVDSLLESRSWRLTKPLRFFTTQGRKLRRAMRGGEP